MGKQRETGAKGKDSAANTKNSAAKGKDSAARERNSALNPKNSAHTRGEKAHPEAAPGKLESRDLIVQAYTKKLQTILDDFNEDLGIETNLTGAQRMRLVSARVRNNGFIDKAFDVANDNPGFLPPHFDQSVLAWKMGNFQDLRQLMAIVDALKRSVSDAFIVQADDCFKDASRIYGSLREQTRANVPGAKSLFELLEIYFKPRSRAGGEPTEKQLEHDVKKLLAGKADGEIIIRNEAPHAVGGVHEVVDRVHKGKRAFKGTVEERVDGVEP